MARFLFTVGTALVLSLGSLYAADSGNKKDNSHERGYHFKGVDENSTAAEMGKTDKQLLAELVKIAKEQLEVQKKILDEVKQIRNPKPEKIVVNGKECIANSSPECFQMPLVPRAKEIPVYKEWLRNPNEQNTLALVQWESQYYNGVSKSARMRDFVITKYGDEALKTSFNRSTFDGIGSKHKVVRAENNRYILNNIANKKFDIVLFFGKNAELDYQSFYNYNRNVRELKDVNYHLVFYTKGSKAAFEDSAKVFPDIKELLAGAKTIKTSKELFKKNSIYASPTMAIQLKESGEVVPITVGNFFSTGIQSRIVKMLVMKNIITPEHSTDYKMFERVGDVGTEQVKHFFNRDLNMSVIKQLYRKEK